MRPCVDRLCSRNFHERRPLTYGLGVFPKMKHRTLTLSGRFSRDRSRHAPNLAISLTYIYTPCLCARSNSQRLRLHRSHERDHRSASATKTALHGPRSTCRTMIPFMREVVIASIANLIVHYNQGQVQAIIVNLVGTFVALLFIARHLTNVLEPTYYIVC